MKTINNSENYCKTIKEPCSLIFKKYIELINEYLLFCIDNIYIQNQKYLKYVLIRGIETIQNVFNILLLYTKNLELVSYHCQKSYYYYVEFIGQIGDDNHSFLQLNSKDATLFVYKKTIFEINNDFRKYFESPTGEDKKKIDELKLLTTIINCITSYNIDNKNITLENDKSLKAVTSKMVKFSEKIILLQRNSDFLFNLDIIYDLVKFLTIKNVECDKFVSILDLFIRRLCNKKMSKKNLETKLYNSNLDILLNSGSNIKIVNWLFN